MGFRDAESGYPLAVRPLALLALLACTALAANVDAASAAPGIRYGIQDDAWLQYGPGTLDQRVTELGRLGLDVVRTTLAWNAVEPMPGEFRWNRADRLLRALSSHGLTLWGTPGWANGGAGPNVAPTSGKDFEAFARLAAIRYPFVRYWVIWNEPNKPTWLRPASPETYVSRILDPAYRGIKSVDPTDRVAGGVTAPQGGKSGTSALDFIRRMASAGARLDAFAHNPYPLYPTETPTTGCSCGALTMGNLDRLLAVVGRAFPRARIWLTEYGYQTRPPDPFGVGYATQARYVGEAAHRAYAAHKVDMLIHYLYRDEPDPGRWQSGLETVAGRAKPALAATMVPLAELGRRGSRTRLWGQIRPGHGRRRFVVQRQRGGPLGSRRRQPDDRRARVPRRKRGRLARCSTQDRRSRQPDRERDADRSVG
jgi:hypothetical protein